MTTLCNLILITWLCVFIIDVSGIIDSIESVARKRIPFFAVPKPFSCSLCMSWWCGLLYLAIVGNFTLQGIALCAVCAACSDIALLVIRTVKEMATTIINRINRQIHKTE